MLLGSDLNLFHLVHKGNRTIPDEQIGMDMHAGPSRAELCL
jgi:hypothetical protein